jgi:hypothetical protein
LEIVGKIANLEIQEVGLDPPSQSNAKRESVLLTIPSSPIEKYNGHRLGLLQSSLKQETCINSILTATTQNISEGACEEGP